MDDCITVMYPCGCEVDFEKLSDVTNECPICNGYLDDEDLATISNDDERQHERRQMGLINF